MMVPLTLRGREDRNMVAWMAGRCDGEHYGELVCYKMPKRLMVDGPMMIEARIGQNREFSEKQTLWSQRGSTIIRGNLLVIPVANSLLYVEPIYIAAKASAIPELKMVALVSSNPARVALGVDLEDALAKLFGRTSGQAADEQRVAAPTAPGAPPASVVQLLDQIITLQGDKQKALASGDLGRFQTIDRQQAELIKQAKKAAE